MLLLCLMAMGSARCLCKVLTWQCIRGRFAVLEVGSWLFWRPIWEAGQSLADGAQCQGPSYRLTPGLLRSLVRMGDGAQCPGAQLQVDLWAAGKSGADGKQTVCAAATHVQDPIKLVFPTPLACLRAARHNAISLSAMWNFTKRGVMLRNALCAAKCKAQVNAPLCRCHATCEVHIASST